MKFTYSCGQRPLDGYEIKRGVGRGGFGEVYFGLSDGGKEVALKVIQSHLDIELRGIQQCLNLKHPNLVHLYDLKADAKGDHWLVMEYVSGEPLGTILARHPKGVAPELACEWFQGLADAIHYLHHHGIVHRDLKPGNIFTENGNVKIGDYGLCKLLGGSQRVGQTQSVGTVHYMAPEVSTGNYNRQIDIYAAGVILYEMLTGRVPFEGETAGEILMKHLTTPPDLSKVPPAFVPILDKALCKNPANRFQTIAEMGKRVAALTVRKTSPAEMPTVVFAPPSPNGYPPMPVPKPDAAHARPWALELSGSLLLAVLLAGVFSFGWVFVSERGDPLAWATTFYLTVLCSGAVLVPAKFWTGQRDESKHRRLTMMCLGLAIGFTAMWLSGFQLPWPLSPETQADSLRPISESKLARRHPFFGGIYPDNRSLPVMAGFLVYFGLMFLILRWWKMAELHRPSRFRFFSVLAVVFWGSVLLFLLPSTPQRQECFAPLVLTSVIVQLASPWKERVLQQTKRLRLRVA